MTQRVDRVTGAVILAAGRGSRLGGVAKALIESDGRSFLGEIAATCEHAGVTPVVVVVAEPFATDVSAAARGLGLEVAVNPEPDRGMASSVAVGFAHAATHWDDCDVALLWPVDHPWVAAETITALLEQAGPAIIAIPTSGDRGGHPAAIGRDLWPAMVGCVDVEGGARAVFRHNRDKVNRFAVSDSGVVRDVDHPGDLG